MTMNLQISRYNVVTPGAINDQGTLISCPVYISPSMDRRKELLNAFRTVKTKQLLEAGYSNQPRQEGSISVHTAVTPPQTPIEVELGTNEEALRMMLFNKQGLNEKFLLKLQRLTGCEVVTREEIEETTRLWIEHIYGQQDVQTPAKTSNKVSRSRKATATKAVGS